MINRLFVITNNTHYSVVKNYINKYPDGINYIILTITPFDGYKNFLHEIKEDRQFLLLCTLFNIQSARFPFSYIEILKNYLKVKKISLNKLLYLYI